MLVGRTIAGICCLMICGLIGCGKSGELERSAVSGTVTFDGNEVEKGIIAFIPTGETKGPAAGAPIENGKFTILKAVGPTPGPHRVEITATRVDGQIDVPGISGVPGGGLSGASKADNIVMYIPEKFNKESTLTVEVQSGDNFEDFTLTSK